MLVPVYRVCIICILGRNYLTCIPTKYQLFQYIHYIYNLRPFLLDSNFDRFFFPLCKLLFNRLISLPSPLLSPPESPLPRTFPAVPALRRKSTLLPRLERFSPPSRAITQAGGVSQARPPSAGQMWVKKWYTCPVSIPRTWGQAALAVCCCDIKKMGKSSTH